MEEIDLNDPYNMVAFLDSFSGLKTLKVITIHSWQPKIDKMLSTHNTLETCELSFGDYNVTAGMLAKIGKHCPHLKRLGFRHKYFHLPWTQKGLAVCARGVAKTHVLGFDD